jgi:hypothetical protein
MDASATAQTLPLLTWAVLLGPMPAVLLLAAATYIFSRRRDDDGN